MLKANPKKVAEGIKERTKVEVMAAHDGMKVEF